MIGRMIFGSIWFGLISVSVANLTIDGVVSFWRYGIDGFIFGFLVGIVAYLLSRGKILEILLWIFASTLFAFIYRIFIIMALS